jgi:hypothetical protein
MFMAPHDESDPDSNTDARNAKPMPMGGGCEGFSKNEPASDEMP